MKKSNLKSVFTLLSGLTLCVGLVFTSCKKAEKGEMGPQGQAGTNGVDGNANVKSNTYTLTVTNWTLSGVVQNATISEASITSDIIDRGTVLVYMMEAVSGGNKMSPLPLTMYPSNSYAIKMDYTAVLGKINLSIIRSDLLQASNPGTLVYKVVVISASARMQNPDVNYSNYNEVKTTFKLQD